MNEDENAEIENKTINEEYKIWKKNTPYLYDTVVTHALDWPTLTCQWFPDIESPPGKPYIQHRLLFGTHTSGQGREYLQIASLQLPKSESDVDKDVLARDSYDDERGELGSHSATAPHARLQIIQKINHEGEVNRARYMPQNPDLIASKAVKGSVFIFDRTKHPSEPEKDGVCRPDIELAGQEKEGFGLDWSPLKKGHILGSSEDFTVCQWDITAFKKGNRTLEPLRTFRGHRSVVGDVSWNSANENIFASVGDDKRLLIWDTRNSSDSEPSQDIMAHEKEILAVAFSPSSGTMLLTGSSDKTIALWDTRSLKTPLHSFHHHTDEILHISWSPTHETIFASASSDRRVAIWDLASIGLEQTPDDADDGPPELLFVHGGHTSRPTDVAWALGDEMQWYVASAAEDNVVQIWKMSEGIYARGQRKVEDMDLE
ncbi:histone acetyltransferase type B subunit 2 [Cantharellus anzutake]|uniref:histone acetyltransferase type B subunit 2 n=1 Tax=Cantharellus anzutake TaxID=1750568 RepID=UPI0019049C12|nr:histone acetyltransferase type B subunit 2 [Cantharellus anzutake]KAF8336363.1 histone acetyltransferase type B subunit 2 [Cantharellus anzutake]